MGIAFAKGDRFTLKGWSNATATLNALISVRPIGWYHRITMDRTSTENPYAIPLTVDLASSRAQGTAHFVAVFDGVIDDAIVNYESSTSLVRGQCYVQLLLQRTGENRSAVSVLAAGYVYGGFTNGGSLPSLNHIAEPGPAGGHGHIRTFTTANPAAGTEVSGTAATVPAGAIWRMRTYTVQLVQGITQTPLPTLRKTGVSGTAWQVPITTVAIGASSTAQLTWGLGLVQSSFTAVVGDEFHVAPLPDDLMIATEFLATVTDGIGANTDYGAAVGTFEEWVMPT